MSENSTKSVLVTGADGFIGRALVHGLRKKRHDSSSSSRFENLSREALKSEGAEVMGSEIMDAKIIALSGDHGDICDSATWSPWEKMPISTVFHLAGLSFIPESWKNPVEFLRVNTLGTAQAAQFCAKTGAHLVFVSAYVYGNPLELPLTEKHPTQANTPYALSKIMAEEICRFHSQTTGLPTSLVRPFNVYGPGQNSRFFIPKVLQQVIEGDFIEVESEGSFRDYVFIDDVVEALILCQTRSSGFEAFNIGSGTSVSGTEVIVRAQEIWREMTGSAAKPVRVRGETRKGDVPEVRADITKAETILGWSPKVSLSEGLRRHLQFLQEEKNG